MSYSPWSLHLWRSQPPYGSLTISPWQSGVVTKSSSLFDQCRSLVYSTSHSSWIYTILMYYFSDIFSIWFFNVSQSTLRQKNNEQWGTEQFTANSILLPPRGMNAISEMFEVILLSLPQNVTYDTNILFRCQKVQRKKEKTKKNFNCLKKIFFFTISRML